MRSLCSHVRRDFGGVCHRTCRLESVNGHLTFPCYNFKNFGVLLESERNQIEKERKKWEMLYDNKTKIERATHWKVIRGRRNCFGLSCHLVYAQTHTSHSSFNSIKKTQWINDVVIGRQTVIGTDGLEAKGTDIGSGEDRGGEKFVPRELGGNTSHIPAR